MQTNNENLKIAIQKSGRLSQASLNLLKNIGLNFEIFERSLFVKCENFPLEIILVRDDDIPEMVQDFVVDLGIVGDNVIIESSSEVVDLMSLDFGKCRFVIAVTNESRIKKLFDLNGKKIATSYIATLRSFFEINKIKAEIIPIKGAVEVAPSLSMADAIADFTSTGSTLRAHDMKEIYEIYKSEAKLISNPKTLKIKEKKNYIDKLKMRIEGVLYAKKNNYIMMNAPEKSVAQIVKILPGVDSPTVVPLNKKGMVAIHSVVPENIFWKVIENLKAVGASGILVSPIEKMIM